jgi:hypothetical protein
MSLLSQPRQLAPDNLQPPGQIPSSFANTAGTARNAQPDEFFKSAVYILYMVYR